MFGKMVLARRHAWVVFAAMFAVFAIGVGVNLPAEQHGSAGAAQLRREHHAGQRPERRQHGRQGGPLRASPTRRIWTAATSDASNGSVNGGFDAHDAGRRRRAAREPLPRRGDLRRRRLGPLRDVLLHRDRGLRRRADGRANARMARARRSRRARSSTPRSARSSCRRWCSSLTALVDRRPTSGLASIFNPGAHGFTEALYAYDSQANNNGSAFAGYGADELLAPSSARSRCYLGRFVPLLAALALGGSLAQKKIVPASAGTFRTDGADVRRPARRRDRAHRRPDDLPGAHARARSSRG